MAWLSFFVMMALSQQFVTGVTYLTHDANNDYYKVPVPWGLYLFEGVVTEVCRGADLKAVCFMSGSVQTGNVHGCIQTDTQNIKAMEEMKDLFSCRRADRCKQLYGLFVDRQSSTKGAVGVLENIYPVDGNNYRSEAKNNNNNNSEGQAFALCGKKISP